jgi:hypothetical protein
MCFFALILRSLIVVLDFTSDLIVVYYARLNNNGDAKQKISHCFVILYMVQFKVSI